MIAPFRPGIRAYHISPAVYSKIQRCLRPLVFAQWGRPSRVPTLAVESTCVDDVEKTITDIEALERIFAMPDKRPLGPSDLDAANRRHDEMVARNPWFRVWQQFGLPR